MDNSFKIGVCQMMVGEQKETNLSRARSMIKEAAAHGSRLIILPEMFNCPYSSHLFPLFAEDSNGESVRMLSESARSEGIYLVGGSIPEREEGQVYNTSFVFGPGGDLLAKHRKIHLFDVDLPDGLSFRESNTLGCGSNITVLKTEICTLGIAICYDLRFPELSRLMALQGAELFVFPAAFNMNTGPAHWELLLRTRAVDNQVFIAGAAPARDVNASYISYGNSTVVDPWGSIISRAEENETIVYADINLGLIGEIRESLPLLKHRREDLYNLTAL